MLATFYIKCRLDKGALKQQISNKTNGLCVPITKKKIAGHRCWTAVRTSSTQHQEVVTHLSMTPASKTLYMKYTILLKKWAMYDLYLGDKGLGVALRMNHGLVLVNICANFFFKISDGWKDYEPDTKYTFHLDNVDLWSQNMTLTLEVRFFVLHMRHGFAMMNICAVIFQNPLMDEGHEIYHSSKTLTFVLQVWPWPSRLGYIYFSKKHVVWISVPNYFKIPLYMAEIWTRYKVWQTWPISKWSFD